MPVTNAPDLVEYIVSKIRDYHNNCGVPRAELDLSGGIDSAVMAALLARALSPANVNVLYSSINSSEESHRRAKLVADTFGLTFLEVDLTSLYEEIRNKVLAAISDASTELSERAGAARSKDATVDGSLRSCLRAPVGRYLNRLLGGIRHGTGNEDEDRWIRFYQKGGDGEVDTNPLASLSKGEVYQLAVELGVPREIIEAMPTPDLQGVGESHNDEDELLALTGVDWTYSRVDPDTGEYTKVGSIEAMSRALDAKVGTVIGHATVESYLFHQPTNEYYTTKTHGPAANVHPMFKDRSVFEKYAASARKLEANTRHKMNPNCPSIVTRQELVDLGYLTNELPNL